MNLTTLAKELHAEACAKGFHTSEKLRAALNSEPVKRALGETLIGKLNAALDRSIVGALCMNQISEVVEIWEAFRKNTLDQPCDKSAKMREITGEDLTCAEEEAADIVIRALDFSADMRIDIDRAVRVKRLFNARRPERNGGKRA